jgi:Fic family protein
VLSSQIEGTQASLTDVLEVEAGALKQQHPEDVIEVMNYIDAMNYGMEKLSDIPLSNILIRQIHERLVNAIRRYELQPGEFRRTQNWIGAARTNIGDANFVPPPPQVVENCMADLEKFIHSDIPMPILIKAGLIHSQFETIHPFLDGNGRMGRLLITFFLCEQKIM